MTKLLGKAENVLRSLFEINIAGSTHSSLISTLTETVLVQMRGVITGNEGGVSPAPDHFRIHANFHTWNLVNKSPGWVEYITDAIQNEAKDSLTTFQSPPRIDPVEEDRLESGVFLVDCDWQSGVPPKTQIMKIPITETKMPFGDHWRVFLIADGKEFPLHGPIFNLGRRETNDLVIPDGRVSRLHAQIRIADGNITIFDLDSTGGTFVNNNRVRSQSLKPGDVISLGGYPLIFNKDIDLNQTDKIEPDVVSQEKPS